MEAIDALLEEMIVAQQKKLLDCATALSLHLTADDILQPNDYEELEIHPFFRYEEGVLKGLQSAQMALRAHFKNSSSEA